MKFVIKIGYFPLEAVRFLWHIILLILTGLTYVAHYVWVGWRIIRQKVTKKPACLEFSPLLGILDILAFLSVAF